jgi:macrodomain Ter protein organizer (MatP/YcbG family)
MISVMKNKPSIEKLEKEIEALKQQLLALGPMHPGSISRQYSKCGTPTCRCHHPTKPKKHGPYNKLVYVHRGKNVCRFVREDCVNEMKDRLATYKTFRKLMDKWIKLSIQRGMSDFFNQAGKSRPKPPKKQK